MTIDIQASPYDPLLWIERGHVLAKLNLGELALGDYHKAQLLCEEGQKTEGEPSEITLAVVSTQLGPDEDARDFRVRRGVYGSLYYLKMEAMRATIETLRDIRCFRDSLQFAEEAFSAAEDTEDREMMMYAVEDAEHALEEWLEELREYGVRGIDFEVASKVGNVSRNPYPWTKPEFVRYAKPILSEMKC
jgi:hypothetical protein